MGIQVFLWSFLGDKLVHSFKEDRLKLYPLIVNIDVSKILRHNTVRKGPYMHIGPLIQKKPYAVTGGPFLL